MSAAPHLIALARRLNLSAAAGLTSAEELRSALGPEAWQELLQRAMLQDRIDLAQLRRLGEAELERTLSPCDRDRPEAVAVLDQLSDDSLREQLRGRSCRFRCEECQVEVEAEGSIFPARAPCPCPLDAGLALLPIAGQSAPVFDEGGAVSISFASPPSPQDALQTLPLGGAAEPLAEDQAATINDGEYEEDWDDETPTLNEGEEGGTPEGDGLDDAPTLNDASLDDGVTLNDGETAHRLPEADLDDAPTLAGDDELASDDDAATINDGVVEVDDATIDATALTIREDIKSAGTIHLATGDLGDPTSGFAKPVAQRRRATGTYDRLEQPSGMAASSSALEPSAITRHSWDSARAPEAFLGADLGPWTLHDLLGKGGMGAVYRATDASGREAAVKVILPGLKDAMSYIPRFEQEARVTERLQHPSIVGFYGVELEPVPYLALEFVPGTNLKSALKESRRFDIPKAIALTRTILGALDFAHGQGVVHRDLKPENVLVHEDGSLRLADFGLGRDGAQDDAPRLTMTGQVMGTPAYMAPEQISDVKSAGPPADLYAVGIMLFHFLTGRPAFTGSQAKILMAHLRKDPPDPRSFNPEVTAPLAELVLKLLAKDPYDRPKMPEVLESLAKAEASQQLAEPTEGARINLEVGQRLGAWELTAELGAGGMGKVFRAKRGDQTAALKVMSPALLDDERARARFEREAQLMSSLEHPNIITVLDVGQAELGGRRYAYMAMEDGGRDLSHRLEAEGPLPLAEAIACALGAAAALTFAHGRSIVHRDVKPENLLIGPVRDRPLRAEDVRLTDFGVAAISDTIGDLTRTTAAVGSPFYMAPEQADRVEDLDGRADLYALGATLYHMVTGARLFAADNIRTLLLAHAQQLPPLAHEVGEDVPEDVALLIDWALLKRREHRPASVEEWAEALRSWSEGRWDNERRKSIRAAVRRGRKPFEKRRPWALMASAAVAVIAVLTSLWLATRGGVDPARAAAEAAVARASVQVVEAESATPEAQGMELREASEALGSATASIEEAGAEDLRPALAPLKQRAAAIAQRRAEALVTELEGLPASAPLAARVSLEGRWREADRVLRSFDSAAATSLGARWQASWRSGLEAASKAALEATAAALIAPPDSPESELFASPAAAERQRLELLLNALDAAGGQAAAEAMGAAEDDLQAARDAAVQLDRQLSFLVSRKFFEVARNYEPEARASFAEARARLAERPRAEVYGEVVSARIARWMATSQAALDLMAELYEVIAAGYRGADAASYESWRGLVAACVASEPPAAPPARWEEVAGALPEPRREAAWSLVQGGTIARNGGWKQTFEELLREDPVLAAAARRLDSADEDLRERVEPTLTGAASAERLGLAQGTLSDVQGRLEKVRADLGREGLPGTEAVVREQRARLDALTLRVSAAAEALREQLLSVQASVDQEFQAAAREALLPLGARLSAEGLLDARGFADLRRALEGVVEGFTSRGWQDSRELAAAARKQVDLAEQRYAAELDRAALRELRERDEPPTRRGFLARLERVSGLAERARSVLGSYRPGPDDLSAEQVDGDLAWIEEQVRWLQGAHEAGAMSRIAPAAPIRIGREDAARGFSHEPAVERRLAPFWIDRTEVTVAAYERFLQALERLDPSAAKAHVPSLWDEATRRRSAEPVRGVTWEDARAFARWLGKRLPGEAEWELAARGEDASADFPWGAQAPTANRARFGGAPGPVAVDRLKDGASPFGCLQMAGNVAEWTSSPYEPYAGDAAERPEFWGAALDIVVRGGDYASGPLWLTVFRRGHHPPGQASPRIGFRCAVSEGGDQ